MGWWGTRGPHDRQGVGIRGNGVVGSVRSKQLTTNNQQPTINNQQSTTNNQQPLT